ncbi:hypothetical protein JCM21900_001179 [Sporobolomyces salmonicolor]
MASPRLLSTLSHAIPSTSSFSLAAPSSSVLRLFSSSPSRSAVSTANRPKRDATAYGLPRRMNRKDWPKKDETNTDAHPLWRFFHNKESLEVPDKRNDYSSRSWSAFELRRKSFTELHQLWYVLLRERNVLLTQREEARRLRVDLTGFTAVPEKLRMVQKSMARVKQIISERRHAAVEAAEILRAEGNVEAADQMVREADKMGEATAE